MVSEPKSEAAKREIALPGFLADLMRDHVDGKGPDDHVFTSPRGGILHPSNTWDRVWRPALKRAGIEDPARLHDLRHTAVSFALASGASPKEAQALAGHASFQTTMNVYGHVLPGAGKATAIQDGQPPGGGPPGLLTWTGRGQCGSAEDRKGRLTRAYTSLE